MNQQNKKQLLVQLAALENNISRLYGNAYAQALGLDEVRKAIKDEDDNFSWEDHPAAKKKLEKIIANLNKATSRLISSQAEGAGKRAVKQSWDEIEKVSKGSVEQEDIDEIRGKAEAVHRGRAASSAEKRGLDISKRVWNYNESTKKEMEVIIQNGIKEGKSAEQIQAMVKGYLNDPNALFRRVRNKKTGRLELSEAAKDYHPGTGVYRSAYKNAMRLARTEVNMAYREAEWLTYQDNPLIVSYEIRLSNNHTTLNSQGVPVALFDICDKLAGVYPKSFRWTGWHPQCRCAMIPVPLTPEQYREYRKAKESGRLAEWTRDMGKVGLPECYKNWVIENADRVEYAMASGKMPYFIRDNMDATNVILHPETMAQKAKRRHEERTEAEVADIKARWEEHQRIQAEIKAIMASNTKPYYEGRFADEIDACTSVKDLVDVLVANKVVTSAKFGTMRLEDAKVVSKALAEVQRRFTLRPIEIRFGGTSRASWSMRANGGHVEINAGLWKGAGVEDRIKRMFYDSVQNYRNRQEKSKAALESNRDLYIKMLDDAKKTGNKASEKYYKSALKKCEKEIKRIETILNSGVSRFTQQLSRETFLRDTLVHELGHVLHDQILGGINGVAFRRARYDVADAHKMNDEFMKLYAKYKDGDRFMTEYGMTKWTEMVAESTVLYMYRPDKLSSDVRDWFERVEKMAHGGKLPKDVSISYDEAYKLWSNGSYLHDKLMKEAERRHAARTPEREEELREFWRKKVEEGDKRRMKEKLLAEAEKRHAARTDEQIQAIIDRRNAELAQFASWEKSIRDTEARAKLNDWIPDEEKTIWVEGDTNYHLNEYYAKAKTISDRMDVIDAMRPRWNLSAIHKSAFKVYNDKLDEARGMIVNGFGKTASDILDMLDEIRAVEPRYVDMRTYQSSHPGKGGKKSKIEAALDEAEALISQGDVKGAIVKIEEAEKTRKINEASALAKAEAARKKKEEAARLKAEAEARKAQGNKDLSKAQSAQELFDMLGDEKPVMLEHYEKSVQRMKYTDQKYISEAAEIERKFKEFFDGCDYAHRVSHSLLEERCQFGWSGAMGEGVYLRDGIPTNLQVNAEGAKATGQKNWTLKSESYDENRRSYGHFAYGYQNSQKRVAEADRLGDGDYYRCGTPVKKDDLQDAWEKGGADGYGDTQIILRKDRVVATFTYGNSLGEHTIPSLVCEPKVCSIDGKFFRNYKDPKYTSMDQIIGGYGYLELQYLPLKSSGQISPKDWKSVTFPSEPSRLMSKWALDRLYDCGVDVYYADSRGKVVLYKKGKPQITKAEAKAKLDAAKAELDNMFINEAALSNKDVSIKSIQDKIKSGDYIEALEAYNTFKAIEDRKKKISNLIPDIDKFHKRFTIDELEAAHKAIEAKIDYMDKVFKTRNSPDEVLRKWEEEIDKAENPDKYKKGAKRFSTWEVAKRAYEKRRNELVYEYHKVKIDDDLTVLRAFSTKDKGFMAKMKEVEANVSAEEWAKVESMIIEAQDIIKGLGLRVIRLGESGEIKFSADEFTQAKRDAAKWFKDPDVAKAYKAADDYMSKYAQEMWKGLTDEEKHILWLYTDGSKYINDEMLGSYSLKCISPIDGSVRNGLADANVVTSIIEKAPALKEAIWMQSGKSAGAFQAMFGIDIRTVRDLSTLVGKEGINNIFSSCHSSSDGYFTKGGSTGVDNPIVLSIYMPAGTKGVYLEPIASYGDNLRWKKGLNWTGTKRREAPSDQVEFLLQRGARFKITNAYMKNGKWYVDVDLIEQTAVNALDTDIPGLMNRMSRTSRKPTLI